MNIYRIFFIIAIFAINLISSEKNYSQNFGTLRGLVSDSTNGEALLFANILIKELEIGASTNDKGYFIFTSVPSDEKYTILISYVGYEEKEIDVVVQPNRVTHVDIQLNPTSFELQTVEKVESVISERTETNIGLERFTIKELEALPKGVETDIFRSLQYTAGVSSTGDVSSRYYVRGGSSDQNLVLVNGVSIYNPFHALGMFSIIDSEIINSVAFHKGGFPAEYGGRVSSVMNILTKDGNSKRFSSKASLSFLTTKAFVEGPIPHGSFFISGRKTHSNQILSNFLDNTNIPIDFYDVSFKLNYSNPDFGKGSKFILHGFQSGDEIKQQSKLSEDYKWKNQTFGATWFQVVEQSPLFFDIGIYSSSFEGEVIPKLSGVRQKYNKVQDITLQSNVSYVFDSNDQLNVGFLVKDIETRLNLENDKGAQSNVITRGSQISLYLKYQLMRYEFLGVDIGTRINLAGLAKNSGELFEPRLNVTYSPLPQFSFKGSIGLYQQELITLSDENEILTIFEPWLMTPANLNPTKAIHSSLGLTTRLNEKLTINLEGYYKDTKNLMIINQEKVFNTDPDFVSGTGEAYGWEATVTYNDKLIAFTSAYTNAWTYRENNGWRYYPKYDSRHSLNLGLSINVGKGWKFSSMWVYKSAIPFTQITGYYDKFYVNDFYFDANTFESTLPYTLTGDINLGRLPDYHRLDLTISKKIQFYALKIDLSGSIINVYDRKNILYFKRDTGERVNMLPFLPTATIKVEI